MSHKILLTKLQPLKKTGGCSSAGVLYRQEPIWPVENESACVTFNENREKQNGGAADLHSENDSFEIVEIVVAERGIRYSRGRIRNQRFKI